jgi:TetR/AcrR family transcriptional regulator, lmrAB and yxaGH operons repressor
MTTTTTRATLIDQIGQVFRDRGYEGATLTQLSAATGLSKASLYHHFPGGKAEMADVLLRDAVAEAQRRAFSHLEGDGSPRERLERFVVGYADYLQYSGGQCLLAVLTLGSGSNDHGERIATQLADWQEALARVFEARGQKRKRAVRSAADLLAQLYGAQTLSKLLGDPKYLRQTLKRLGSGIGKKP